MHFNSQGITDAMTEYIKNHGCITLADLSIYYSPIVLHLIKDVFGFNY